MLRFNSVVALIGSIAFATTHCLAEDCPRATKLLSRAERLSPKDEKSVKLLDEAMSLCPSLASAHYLRAVAHFENNELVPAEQAMRKALSLGEEPRFRNGLARVLLAKGEYDEAKQEFEKALQQRADDSTSLQGLAVALHELGQLTEAEQALRRALQSDSDSADLFLNLGIILEEQKRVDEAVGSYQAAIERRPGFAEAYRRLATAQLLRGEIAEAAAAVAAALAHAPKEVATLTTHVAVLDAQGEYRKALEVLAEAARAGDDVFRNKYNRAILLAKTGNVAEAESLLGGCVDQDAQRSACHSALGWLYVQMQQWDKAVAPLLRATSLNPDDAFAQYNLGLVYEQRGDSAEAQAAFQQAVKLSPDTGRFKEKLKTVQPNL